MKVLILIEQKALSTRVDTDN